MALAHANHGLMLKPKCFKPSSYSACSQGAYHSQLISTDEVPQGQGSRLLLANRDLSHPEGFSVSDGIRKEMCSLTYLKLDEVAKAILQLGRGARMAKRDVANAYRVVPVHPADRHLLGMRWEDGIYVDATLSFGLRSALKMFTAIADGVCWGLKSLGIRYVDHYLDDIITVGCPETSECRDNCNIIDATLRRLGLPAAVEKSEGPTTKLEYLGIELDSVALELRLPQVKLVRLIAIGPATLYPLGLSYYKKSEAPPIW